MSYTLRFLPAVGEDALTGYIWYERKASGLGEEFLRMFYACAGEIPQNPSLYPEIHGTFRRRLLRRFPYAIYFRIVDSDVAVFGLFHCARNPRSIDAALQDRDE